MSLKLIGCCLISVTVLAGAAVHAQCTAPTPSAIPDGSTASEQEMLTAMKAFKQYDADATAYLKCLESETLVQIAKRSGERSILKEKQMEQHNATVDALQAAASRFNKQVRIYKDRSKG